MWHQQTAAGRSTQWQAADRLKWWQAAGRLKWWRAAGELDGWQAAGRVQRWARDALAPLAQSRHAAVEAAGPTSRLRQRGRPVGAAAPVHHQERLCQWATTQSVGSCIKRNMKQASLLVEGHSCQLAESDHIGAATPAPTHLEPCLKTAAMSVSKLRRGRCSSTPGRSGSTCLGLHQLQHCDCRWDTCLIVSTTTI